MFSVSFIIRHQVFGPGAAIEAHSKNKFPLRLRIDAVVAADGDGEKRKMKVWNGDQKRLFQKRPEEREECVEEIKVCLLKLRDELAA
ncbi:hypothetical protein ACHAXT_001538 [Thalassiosira profunda]